MPRASRARTLAAPADRLWAIAGDPHHMVRWWPDVDRVEDVDGNGFTLVATTAGGRPVRSDYRIVDSRPGRSLRFAQRLAGTPFQRILAASEVEIALEPDADGATRVTLTISQRLRGASRLGGFIVAAAGRRRLEAALDGLEAIA